MRVRCYSMYHGSLDSTAAKGRGTHAQVAEQLWPGSRLACRATRLCTPSRGEDWQTISPSSFAGTKTWISGEKTAPG
jgi:hypothetical protein